LVFGERRGLAVVAIVVACLVLAGGVTGYYYLEIVKIPQITGPVSKANNNNRQSSGNNNGNNGGGGKTSYFLQLVNAGSGSSYFSNLSTPQSLKYLVDENDKPNYNGWIISGDFEPGQAWFSANKSGLTLTDKTCFDDPYTSAIEDCGPYWEWNGDNHEEFVSELSGVLYNISPTLTVFTIYVYIPYYPSFQACVFNVSSSGCSYEGQGPTDQANWALNVVGPDFNSILALSIAEGRSGLFIHAATASTVNGHSISNKILASVFQPVFTSFHKLTIATDRSTFLDYFVDDNLIYSTNTMPVNLNGSSLSVNFYQFTSVNNMTISTTWSNYTAYSASKVFIIGLSSGQTVFVRGPNGFTSSASSDSNGIATVDVSAEPTNLTVSIEVDGAVIATYQGTVEAGATLKLVVT
jgi:hypothetical protein